MLHQPDFSSTKPHPYERIGHRVQRLIADPRFQKVQCVRVTRLPEECPVDWRRLICEIEETAGVNVDEREDGSIDIAWNRYCEA